MVLSRNGMTRPLVSLKDADVTLEGRRILRGISWRLLPGEHWAILGGNGSGKSTFLRLVRGELWPASGCGKRAYSLDGAEQTTSVGVKAAVALVSPELQQRYLRQEWRLTGRQVIESGFGGGDYAYSRLSVKQDKAVIGIARLMGVEKLLGRNAQELSTGELRRLLVARALASAPQVLACDEICDGLDAATRAGLLETLGRVARRGTQLLFTTHRDDEWLPAITHRLVLENGRIVECGQIGSSILTPTLTPAHGLNPNLQAPFGPQSRIRSKSRRTPQPVASPRVLIRIRSADVFLGPRRVLRNVNWEMRSGEHWAVLGPNGAGKSTFLKLVLGDVQPAWGGRVTRFNFTARDMIWTVKRRIGIVSPELQAAYQAEVTGADVIGSGFHSSVGKTFRLNARQRRRVCEVARWFGIESLLAALASRISYGEFRKLLLARALVHEPELLLCDEPFDGLDAAARRSMAVALERVAGNGTSLLVVTHHADDLPACTTHLVRLASGRITYQGPAARPQ
jgi:molybdate transport system ATP-binding protein